MRSLIDTTVYYSLNGIIIAVDNNRKSHLELEDRNDIKSSSKTWKCNLTRRTFSSEDRQSIINLKNVFTDESIEKVRDLLQNLDGSC